MILLFVLLLPAACDPVGPVIIEEPVGALIVYGNLLDGSGNLVTGPVRIVAWGDHPTCAPTPPAFTDTVQVTTGHYRLTVPGGFGLHPSCVELRFLPDPSLQLDTVAASGSVPFRPISQPPDSLELDVVLRP